ncbi:MAG: hypothetical protein KIT59_00105 [Nitrosomonas sp.]|nr:hypothetical protein [Nitrosomonas sp.]
MLDCYSCPRSRSRISWLMTILLAMSVIGLLPKSFMMTTASAAESSHAFPLQQFLDLEIEGISLSAPPEKIPAQLEDAGYHQIADGIFIKEAPIPGGRKSTYRIEVEETAELRSITYVRGEMGGRNKSPVEKNRPIPANEVTWVKTLYELVCSRVPEKSKNERACQPLLDWQARFGEGEVLRISDQAGARLDASGASTTLALIYFKK